MKSSPNCECGLFDAALVEPGAVLPVQCLDVLDVTLSQGAEQRPHGHAFAVLHPMSGLKHSRKHAVVLDAVLFQARESRLAP